MIIKLTNGLSLAEPEAIPEGYLRQAENVTIDRNGAYSVRRGSTKGSDTSSAVHRLLESDGDRYAWAGTACYKNETSFGDTLTNATPSAFKGRSYNESVNSIFFLNGTDRKRIQDDDMYEWGTTPPAAPTLVANLLPYSLVTGTHNGGDDASALTDTTVDFLTKNIESGTDTLQNTTDGSTVTVSHVTETTVTGTLAGGAENNWDDGDVYNITRDLPDGVKHRVKITYVRKEGSTVVYESDPSEASDQLELPSGGKLQATVVASTDSQITHIRFYRTTNNGAIYYYEQEEDNTSGTYILYLTDTQLAASTELETDHDRPPLGTVCAGPYFNGYGFILKDHLLYWSKPKQLEYWPLTYYVELSEPQDEGMAITEYNGTVFVATREKILQIQGSGSLTFYPVATLAFTGTCSKQVFKSVPNLGIVHLGQDGLYVYNGTDRKLEILDPIFEQLSADGLPNLDKSYIANCWVEVFEHKLYFGYPSGATYPDTVVCIDIATLNLFKYTYGTDFSTVMVDKTNNRLYAGADDGYVWQLENGDTDDGTAIATTIQTKDLDLPTRKYSVQWVKYDAYCNGSDTLNASVEIDGESVQTHALSDKDRETNKRIVTNNTGNRISLKFTGSGPDTKVYSVQEIE